MEIDYDSRPVSAVHRDRDWGTTALNVSTTSPVATSSNFASRRRSTAGHTPPPPGPPPSQPIPRLPTVAGLTRYEAYDGMPDASGSSSDVPSLNATYSRPSPSPGLAAVTAFSQARYASISNSAYSSTTLGGSPTDLADSPPPSILRGPIAQPPAPSQDISADRLLLPMDHRSSNQPRPSSRRALTKALELAREAVRLDSTNDDPYGAVMAYARSVALLSEVMGRVMRGEDSTETSRRRNGRRRSVVAQEEEVRRLKSIHDTYADRMNILSVVYDIPLPPHSPPSVSSVSGSTDSTRPSSPSSVSPTSEVSDASSHSRSLSRSRERDSRYSAETARGDNVTDEEPASLSRTGSSTSLSPLSSGRSIQSVHGSASPVHPYALASVPAVVSPVGSGSGPRTSVIRTRPRASSTLPPPAPPPTTLPPPAPSPTTLEHHEITPTTQTLRPVDSGSRSRGNSVSHKRTSSGSRLASLREESLDVGVADEQVRHIEEALRPKSRLNILPHGASPPLPPLPSPSIDAVTPRTLGTEPGSPSAGSSNFMTPRPRGGSTVSVRSDATPTSKPTLINPTTNMGTISQRRGKSSVSPPGSGDAPSPTDSTMSAASVPNMGGRIALPPVNAAAGLGLGRTRASSQPARRPSIVTANSYHSGSITGSPPAPRKASTPSRLNPNASAPPQITLNTSFIHKAMQSPPILTLSVPSLTSPPLVPPPPIPYENIPAAPLSPLPVSAPLDPLRKPYHMMFLLRQTMTSKTGGYITRRLHVPQEVWSQGGAKLSNVPEKIRVVEVLCSALEELQHCSADCFGAGNVSSGMALGIGSIGRKEGELWTAKLEEFSSICDGVVGQFGKKLGVGEGFVTKKSSGVTSWGGRLTRQFDKITNGKNLDSPALYVQGLLKLFQAAQILDEHTKAAAPSAVAPLYTAIPLDVRAALELKLRHASEFFAKVVLTFVIRDMALLLDKYVKKCEKWLAE